LPIAPAPAHAAWPVRPGARLAVTWVGHATTLVQLDDKVVLTDPLFSATAGYMNKRWVAPGLKVREVPPLNAVLVSHMHFDHLSFDSLFALKRKVGELVLPEHGDPYVPDYGFPRVELATWQSWEQGGLRITAVPVKHVGWRYGIDSLFGPGAFCGYVIEYHGLTVYFGGDSAYLPEAFKATREHFPHIDLALLAIGPIEPRGFMSHTHMDPKEALQAFRDLGAAKMVPIHYETFLNSMDRQGDVPRALDAAMAELGLTEREVVRMAIGEQKVFVEKPR
jgi:L-ascorbate metabolism protein UlaG (beta-lactamase superfamily)